MFVSNNNMYGKITCMIAMEGHVISDICMTLSFKSELKPTVKDSLHVSSKASVNGE